MEAQIYWYYLSIMLNSNLTITHFHIKEVVKRCDMVTDKTKSAYCPFCMKDHEVGLKVEPEMMVFKGEDVSFPATYLYCRKTDEYYEDEITAKENDLALKDAYREKMGLLKSSEIVSLRDKYGITQTDLCVLLGWGGKTIARYEGSQVRDNAHDMILRKISEDPSWYMDILVESRNKIPERSYEKYYLMASAVYEKSGDYYLHELIRANCAKYRKRPEEYGNADLSFAKIVDLINYLSSSKDVDHLYKVKLMKMMWYADALSYKDRGCSITGLPYLALAMGAVPESHDYIIKLGGINFTVEMIGENEAYHFQSEKRSFPSLTSEDKKILDRIISVMGKWKADQIISYMHDEEAYRKTKENDVISFEYAKNLSIDV